MGQLVDGTWVDGSVDATKDSKGRFIRQRSTFRDQLGTARFPATPGRYHLYVQWACPWSHRVFLLRELLGLQDALPMSMVHPEMLQGGWKFTEDYPDGAGDHRFMHEVYTDAEPDHTGKVTVPVLWDTQQRTIVNNESSDLVRMLLEHADAMGGRALDLYPEPLRAEIDTVCDSFYESVNNGVYRCGFARSQEAYDEAFEELFDRLDALEAHLTGREWLVGDQMTLADIQLWVTLVRFDAVYVTHFKCNLRRLVEYPALQAYTERLYRLPGFGDTTRFDEIKTHYYRSHESLNPKGIVPRGFALRFDR